MTEYKSEVDWHETQQMLHFTQSLQQGARHVELNLCFLAPPFLGMEGN